MRSAYRALTILAGAVGLIFPPAFQVAAENIYHWKDRSGISCYSNTNIPRGTTEFSVMRAAGSAAPQADGPDVADDANAGAHLTPAAKDPEAGFGSKEAILKERIEQQRTSIRYIENLLKTRPNDSGLRKRFYQKKENLNENIIRLELLAK